MRTVWTTFWEKAHRYSSRGMLVHMAWVPPSKLRLSSESDFSIPVSKCDVDILELSPSGCENRQILEVPTGLIALRLWSKFWQGERAKLAGQYVDFPTTPQY